MKSERAIVLRRIKYGESDLIVSCLNQEGCRLNLMAKGALRSRRRFAGGVLEPLNYIKIVYQIQASPDSQNPLHWLKEAQLLRGFQGLRQDYDRLEMGIYFLHLVSQVGREGEGDNHSLFDLLGNSLGALETTGSLKYLKLLFELKILHQQGVLDYQAEGAGLVRWSIRDHEQICLDEPNFLRAKGETHRALEAYLHK